MAFVNQGMKFILSGLLTLGCPQRDRQGSTTPTDKSSLSITNAKKIPQSIKLVIEVDAKLYLN